MKAVGYDVIIGVDTSGSMEEEHKGMSLWDAAQENALCVARKAKKIDSDGITFGFFGSRCTWKDAAGPEEIKQLFQEREPMGRTATHEFFAGVRERFAALKESGNLWDHQGDYPGGDFKKGVLVFCFTDGKPDDPDQTANEIIDLTQLMDTDAQCAIQVIQLGEDPEASHFLDFLDDHLTSDDAGAKFDIVDTTNNDKLEELGTFQELIDKTLED